MGCQLSSDVQQPGGVVEQGRAPQPLGADEIDDVYTRTKFNKATGEPEDASEPRERPEMGDDLFEAVDAGAGD